MPFSYDGNYKSAMQILDQTEITISLFFNEMDVKIDDKRSEIIQIEAPGCIDFTTEKLVEYNHGPEMSL